jgi:hypothetical protein
LRSAPSRVFSTLRIYIKSEKDKAKTKAQTKTKTKDKNKRQKTKDKDKNSQHKAVGTPPVIVDLPNVHRVVASLLVTACSGKDTTKVKTKTRSKVHKDKIKEKIKVSLSLSCRCLLSEQKGDRDLCP